MAIDIAKNLYGGKGVCLKRERQQGKKACYSRYIDMENNNKYENNTVGMAQYYGGDKYEEPEIFKGKKVQDKSEEVLAAALQKRAKSQNKSSDSNAKEKNDSTTDENSKKQDCGSPMENMLEYLMECFEFISVNNKELYYYIPEYGYWKLVLPKSSDIEFRKLLTTSWAKYINSSSMMELYKWLLIEARHVEAKELYSGKHYLNFKDKAYNWKEDKFEKDRREKYFTYVLNCDYPEDGSDGTFEKFIDGVFEDEVTKIEFAKFAGLALSGIRHLKYVFFLFGPSNSSKSTILNLIKYVVGENECSSLSFSQLSKEFFLSMLYGVRLNISAEISGISVQKLDILKSLSGNDTVAASFKFQDTFAFDNKALLAFACNSLPKIEDIGEFQSFASRMIIYPFTRVIERKDWDLKLQEKLRADIAGFLNFAINGLRQLEADEYIINESESMLQVKADYAGVTESFSGFCDKYIKRDSGSAITSTDIKNAYHHYCHVNDYVELKDNQWSGLLQRAFGAIRATKTIYQNNVERRARVYRGVAFKKSLSELLDEQPPEDAVAMSTIFENKE